MSRFRITLFSALGIVAVSAVGASGASAAIQFLWSVNGTKLTKTSQTEKVSILTDATDPTMVFTSKVAGETTELTSNEASSANAVITGGLPGTSTGKAKFINVKIVKPQPTKCQVHSVGQAAGSKIVETTETEGTLVESVSGGKVLLLFKAINANGILFELEFENITGQTCIINGQKAKITGSAVATEDTADTAKLQLWTFEKSGTQSRSSAGVVTTNSLQIGTAVAELIGSRTAEVASSLGWGGL